MKKNKNKYNIVTLFSGAGGLTLGLKKAGFKVLAGVEINPVAASTYRANHPDIKLFECDIKKISEAHMVGKLIVKETATEGMPIEMNEGAIKFLKE